MDSEPVENTYRAALRVISTTLPLADLVEKLGEPSRSHDIGDLKSPRMSVVFKHSYWGWRSTDDNTVPLEDQVEAALDYFDSRRSGFEEIRPAARMDIFCGVFSGDSINGGFGLDPPLLQRLADSGLAIIFDVY